MGDTGRLAKVFVELADTLVDEFDMLDFLQVLAERSVQVLPVEAAALMLTDQRGDMKLLACTPESARAIAQSELDVGAGPSLECFSTGRAIVNVDPADAQLRWPAPTSAAHDAGYRATHAFPMRLRGQLLGALVLFGWAERIEGDAVTIAQAMADVATIGLIHERSLFDEQLLSEQLQAALHSRVMVEQAKGMLAARAGISVSAAFTRMRSHARTQQLTMTAVATAVVNGSVDERILTGA